MSIAIVTFLCDDIIASGMISGDMSTWPGFHGLFYN